MRLSHRAVPLATVVWVDPRLENEAVQGNRFPWNGLRHLEDSGNGGTTLEFRLPYLWRVPPLEM